jgi:hypothetical protein
MSRHLLRHYASPSLFVSIIALVVALGGAGYSATGSNFILGRSNAATTASRLTADIDGRTLTLANGNAGPAATPLALFAAADRPPFLVNSSIKVAKLNADQLDGLDSNDFSRRSVTRFNLAANAVSEPIAVPLDRPVLAMGVTNAGQSSGVGLALLLRTPNAIFFSGFNYGQANTTSGNSDNAGFNIVRIDMGGLVRLEVNDAQTIRVHNTSPTTSFAGAVTLMW